MAEIPIVELLWLAAGIAGAGVITGLLAGLFGIGGGAVIVPVLYEIFRLLGVSEGVIMQLCVGTSLAIIFPTTIRSYAVHSKRGVVPRVIRLWALPAIGGVAIGVVAAAFAPSAFLRLAFALFAGLMALGPLFGNDRWRIADELPGQPAMIAYGFIIGLCSALMGVSGGLIATMILTLYGKPIHNAVATATGIGIPITLAGTAGYMIAGATHQDQLPVLSIGFVSLVGFALLAPVSSFVASYGARLAYRIPKRRLEIAYALFLMAAAARFLIGAVL